MKAVSKTQEKMCDMEYLRKQLETQKSTLENLEMENIRLTQRLQDNLEEIQSVTKERDDLRSVEETLKVERDQLKENLRETAIRVRDLLFPVCSKYDIVSQKNHGSRFVGNVKLVQRWGRLKEERRVYLIISSKYFNRFIH